MEPIRSIRTSPQNARRDLHDGNSTLRLIAKVLREVVSSRRFSDYTDVKDALRRRLLALKIRYTAREFDDAFSVVGSNLPIIRPAAKLQAPRPLIETPISRNVARDILANIRAHLQCQIALKTMPATTGYTKKSRAS